MVAVSSAGASQNDACQRDYGRAPIAMPASLEMPMGSISCTICDVSLGGAKIKIDHAVPVGESLWLALGKVRVFATVQWVRGKQIGVKFEEKLPKALVLSLRGETVDPKALEDAEARLVAQKWEGGRPAARAKEVRIADVLGTWNPGSIASSQSGRAGRRRSGKDASGTGLSLLVYAGLLGALVGVGSYFLM
ncbi:MAG: PilZ domain-containing protein [Sphingopyxis sp.]|nr:PilZ domain-containing protein [Sphingopyxis sp.]